MPAMASLASKGQGSPMSTLSYAHGVCAEPLLGETIGANLRRAVDRFGDREALVVRHQNHRATYRQIWDNVTAAARGLLALGVHKGDRVGIWAPNRWEWVVLQYAAARVGAILVNVNPAYKRAELEYVLTQSGVSVLFLAAGFRKTAYRPLFEEARPRCPFVREALMLDVEWDGFLRRGERIADEELDRREAALEFDDAINIQYTSGTTGFPKGATLSHHNILNNAYFAGRAVRYSPADRVCIPVPFYHCFGMVLGNLACTCFGACMVIPGEAFDPLAVLETVDAERCTSLYGVPTMFIAELEHPRFAEFNVTSLRTGIIAGAPCPLELMNDIVTRLHMPEIAIGYGMTETSPLSTMTAHDDPLCRRVGTVGRTMAHCETKIIDLGGAVVPRGEAGELCTRGYGVMLGYWNDEAATKSAIDAAGWMHSGDLATMDAEGYVNIVGRLKDMIIRGGENISPREIEELLHTHPKVSEAQVIGLPSAKYGEEVMAWIKVRPGQAVTEEDLIAFCRGKVATYKVPQRWKFVDVFPMTVTGKVQKFRMREMAVAELGLEAVAQTKTA
jgi:fatty-acyl-CoA synthase